MSSSTQDAVDEDLGLGQLVKVRGECEECGLPISDPTDLDAIIGMARAHERNDEDCEMRVELIFEDGSQEVDW